MTLFKICGLRQLDHAQAAADAGADFLGFNFVPGVRRQVSEEHAGAITGEIRRLRGTNRPRLVGLFADQPMEDVNRIVRSCGLDLAQLCGDEPPDYWERVEVPVIKQIKVRDGGDRERAIARVRSDVEDVVSRGRIAMLDSHEAGSLGGTGRSFDWAIAAAVAREHDFLLAGGLTPDNVAEAIATAGPWGVDVSSGVETERVKDPKKIAAFAEAVLRAGDHSSPA